MRSTLDGRRLPGLLVAALLLGLIVSTVVALQPPAPKPSTAPADVAATTDHGIDYCSILHRGNVYATQFHPEKSGDVGLAMIKNFAEL